MSGIVGIFGGSDKERIRKMLEVVKHRGIAGWDIFVGDKIVLGQNWHESKANGSSRTIRSFGDLVIVFDGFITNRSALNVPGDDAEAVLILYQRYREDCLGMLDGMFSFALFDGERLLLARDPFGIRPLYIAQHEGALYFASEMKALLFSKTITNFPPGRYLHLDLKKIRANPWFIPYFSLNIELGRLDDSSFVARKLGLMLKRNISACIRREEKVSSLLSGGIDSSVITAIAQDAAMRLDMPDWHTFCVGVVGAEDLRYAALVAEELETIHHEYILEEEEILKVLPSVIYHLESFDAPLVRSSVANYIVAREANRHSNALLCGEGGDELFAGYTFLNGLTPEELRSETINMLNGCHNTALQRDDRMTGAHGIENRVPFFSKELADFALSIDQRLKHRDGVEKYILRKCAEPLLPSEVVWRPKEKFWAGSGSGNMLTAAIEKLVSDREFKDAIALYPHINIKTKEELYYFKIFKERFPAHVIEEMGRTVDWRPR